MPGGKLATAIYPSAQTNRPSEKPDFSKGATENERRILTDPKFRFLVQTAVPKVQYKLDIEDVNFLILYVGNYVAAHSIALDPFSRYRLEVMEYIMNLKKHSLTLGDHEPDRTTVLVFTGVVFDTFNKAQIHLVEYHEGQIQAFTDYFQKLTANPIHLMDVAKLIATKMRRMLTGYEMKMKQMKAAIQKCLAMLYKIHIKGV